MLKLYENIRKQIYEKKTGFQLDKHNVAINACAFQN